MAEAKPKRIQLADLNSIKDVPKEEVWIDNGKTLLLKDGTRVSDELIKQAKAEAAARTAATSAAMAAKVDLDDPAFVARVQAIATEAAQKAINEANAAKEKDKDKK